MRAKLPLVGIAVLEWLVFSACAISPTTPSPTSVTVQLRWLHQAQFAGFYAADQNGYYAEEGLAVNFVPGGPNVDIHAPVHAGEAQFGVAGADTLILKRAEGVPFRAVATLYRRNPLVFMALADSGIQRPQDFAGKTIKVAPFNATVLHAMTARVGVTPDQYTEVCCSLDGFFTGEIQVAEAYLTNDIIAVETDGYQVNIINPDDYGVHFYADTLYTTDDVVTNRPDLIRRFLRATLRGWTYAIENPTEAAALVSKYNPQADPEHELAQMTASLPLVNTGEDHIGWMQPEVWANMETTLREQGLLTRSMDLANVYSLEFLREIYGE